MQRLATIVLAVTGNVFRSFIPIVCNIVVLWYSGEVFSSNAGLLV